MDALTVSGFMRSLKPSWTIAFVGTFVAPLDGLTVVTVGVMRSTRLAVVNRTTIGPLT